tara:strand:- start:413 stop:1702 length:1290 start_codon:yes stop_codon:yes gene_type:complete
MALDKVTTKVIADDAVTGAKIENNPTVAGNLTVAGNTTLSGTSTLTGNATASGNLTVTGDIVPSTPFSHRNMVINGGMQVWQRGTALADAGNGTFKADRWKNGHDISGTIQNASETLSNADFNTTGHKTALVVSCSGTDTSVAAGHQVVIAQWIEAQNVQHLQYGTANAQDLVVSFWAKADSAATYAVSLTKPDNTAYAIAKEFTVSTSWQKFTITFGSSDTNWATTIETAGGLIDNNNDTGLVLGFTLACGSTFQLTNGSWTSTVFTSGYGTSNVANFADATSRKFHLTGVQLELGSSATPFEHRSYSDELKRCHRYYFAQTDGGTDKIIGKGAFNSSGQMEATVFFKEVMRVPPSLVFASGSDYYRLHTNGSTIDIDDFNIHAKNLLTDGGCTAVSLYKGGLSSVAGNGVNFVVNNNSGYCHFNSEL